MRVICLSGTPYSDSFLLSFADGDFNLLVDFPPLEGGSLRESRGNSVSLHTLRRESSRADSPLGALSHSFVLPCYEILDIPSLNTILVSNHRSLVGVYLMFRTFVEKDSFQVRSGEDFLKDGGFRGKIYATYATLHFGRLYLEELAEYEEASKGIGMGIENLGKYIILKEKERGKNTRIFDKDLIKVLCGSVETIGYGELVEINTWETPSRNRLVFQGLSNGYQIGSCNWEITFNSTRIGYISSSASAISRYPRKLNLEGLHGCDVLIATSLSGEELNTIDSMRTFSDAVFRLVSRRKNVIVPIHSVGVLFDAINALNEFRQGAVLRHVDQLYVVTPKVKEIFSLATIMGEFINPQKLEEQLMDSSKPTLAHEILIRAGKMTLLDSLSREEMKFGQEGCSILFISHPSLRFGLVRDLNFERLVGDTTLVFIEPEVPGANIDGELRKLQPKGKSMSTRRIPQSVYLSYGEAISLCNALAPQILLASSDFVGFSKGKSDKPPLEVDGSRKRKLDTQSEKLNLDVREFGFLSELYVEAEPVELETDYYTVNIGEKLARTTFMKKRDEEERRYIGLLSGTKYNAETNTLEAVERQAGRERTEHLFGRTSLDKILEEIGGFGFEKFELTQERRALVLRLYLEEKTGTIKISRSGAHIESESADILSRMTEILAKCHHSI